MQLNLVNIIFVGLGGALGSITRYLVSIFEKYYFKAEYSLPLATLSVNLIGSFIIGCFLSKLLQPNFQHSAWTSFMVIGLLGGFTTFSSFSAENIKLIMEGKIFLAILYIFISITIGLLMTYLGFLLART